MLLSGRHGSVDSDAYRYGFQGQERDDEVKGEGNSFNYKYRMHDPRIGRFFAIDPLSDDYPYYSPYQFSGNTPIMSTELEGLEPHVQGGILVGYHVQAGQGPTQIAMDINDPKTQEQYGYTLQEKVTWQKIVDDNYTNFWVNGNWDFDNGGTLWNKQHEAYTKLNINTGDYLRVIIATPIKQDAKELISPEFTVPVVTYEAAVSLGPGMAINVYQTGPIPKKSIYWEGGRKLKIESISSTGGAPGASWSIGVGAINMNPNSDPSLNSIIGGANTFSVSGGFISPVGIGGQYNGTFSDQFNINTAGVTMGIPGVIAGASGPGMGNTTVDVIGGMTVQDSIMRAFEILKYFKSAEHAKKKLEDHNINVNDYDENGARKLRADEM